MRFIRKHGRVIPIREKLDHPGLKYAPMVALSAAAAFTGAKGVSLALSQNLKGSLQWSAASGVLGKLKFMHGGLYVARALKKAKKSDKLEAATMEGVKQTAAGVTGALAGFGIYAMRKRIFK